MCHSIVRGNNQLLRWASFRTKFI